MRPFLAWLRSNVGSATLAFVMGLAIWIIVNQEQNPVQEADLNAPIPIEVIGLQPGLIVTSGASEMTQVRLRAQQQTWSSLSPNVVTATVDLTGLGPGTHQVRLDFIIDAQAILVSANPSTMRIEIEESRTRDIPVQTNLEGQLSVGYTAGQPAIQPRRVTVTGPKSAVELISEVRANVPVEGLREDFTGELTLVALDASGNRIAGVTIQPQIVNVTIPITQDAGYRDIAIQAITIGAPINGYYVTGIRIIPDLITVRGDPAIIEAMQPIVENNPVSLDGLTSSVVREITLNLPPGVTPVSADPIQMFISIQALQGSIKVTVPVQIVGLKAGQTATVVPTTIEAILSGPLPVLNLIRIGEDIIVSVDATDLAPGTYQLEPHVQVFRSEVKAESIFPSVISITIKAQPLPH